MAEVARHPLQRVECRFLGAIPCRHVFVRGSLRAGDHGPGCNHQTDRERNCGARLPRRMDPAGTARSSNRQTSGDPGLRTCRPCRGAAAESSRSHAVVFEKADQIGGLLRYGIPDFKLEKSVLDRRLEQLVKEGIEFQTRAHAGVDLRCGAAQEFDAVLLAGGAGQPRDLKVPGRELMEFVLQWIS